MSSYHFDHQPHQEILLSLFKELELLVTTTSANSAQQPAKISPHQLTQLLNKYPKDDDEVFAKDELIQAYRELAGSHGLKPLQKQIISWLRKKPTRTDSGVTPITVLTKPFPCPGRCIFCPNDIRMPKSYLADEPGAQRAERNYFDPYLQTYNRLQALHNIGHNIEKAELIILGGTWSYYPEAYQIWFVKECFRALNEFGQTDSRPEVLAHYEEMNARLKEMQAHQLSPNPEENQQQLQTRQIRGEQLAQSYNQVVSEVYTAPERIGGFDQYQSASWSELIEQQRLNETAKQRSVGLVIETRPDNISEAEVRRIRRLGATKAQIGVQSLQDRVLELNHRGHDVAATRRAFRLLRQAGFKIHAHWMANLYGSSVEQDKADFMQLFADPDFRPDELKIYPCSLIESAELMQYYQAGKWRPYSHDELLEVVSYAVAQTPPYCRLTRVIRDIPSTDIVAGNKKTNFRQIADQHLAKSGIKQQDIRAREIRREQFEAGDAKLDEIVYQTSAGEEHFLQFILPDTNQILAFLRLSLPTEDSYLEELGKSAVIREIHVYGQALGIGKKNSQRPQHLGFGTQLIKKAREIAREHGYQQLAVISAIGTREYYRKKGFTDGDLYQSSQIDPA